MEGNQNNQKSKTKTIAVILIAAVSAGGAIYREWRKHRQKKLQKRVNSTSPVSKDSDTFVEDDQIRFSIIENEFDVTKYDEFSVSEKESEEWKTLLSTLGGEFGKVILTTSSFNGLLKCNVPVKTLCRVKDTPELLRGFVLDENGKITKQASFSEVGISNVAPLFVYQLMAAVTSQYYQQIITDRLNVIDSKLTEIIQILIVDDQAKLKVLYSRFFELSKKTSFDIADKVSANDFHKEIGIVGQKYFDLLQNIESKLKVSFKNTNKAEAKQKVAKFESSNYLKYLEMAMQSDALLYMSNIIMIKIAKALKNDQDAEMYLKRINLDFWNKYSGQYHRVKHDIIEYLELERKNAMINKGLIAQLIEEQTEKFKDFEEEMLRLQNQFDLTAVYIIRKQDNGELKRYVPKRNNMTDD